MGEEIDDCFLSGRLIWGQEIQEGVDCVDIGSFLSISMESLLSLTPNPQPHNMAITFKMVMTSLLPLSSFPLHTLSVASCLPEEKSPNYVLQGPSQLLFPAKSYHGGQECSDDPWSSLFIATTCVILPLKCGYWLLANGIWQMFCSVRICLS